MARKLLAVGLVVAVVVCAGCVMPRHGAVLAPIMDTKSAVAVGDTSVGYSKVGESMAEGIILLGKGDASISEAMKDGGITRIHHVDSEELNILNIYCKQIIRVYGE
jgi:hypothetical protein